MKVYLVEYTEPGKAPVARLMKVSPAMRLSRKLMAMGLPYAIRDFEDVELCSAREIEDLIDDLERRYPTRQGEHA